MEHYWMNEGARALSLVLHKDMQMLMASFVTLILQVGHEVN